MRKHFQTLSNPFEVIDMANRITMKQMEEMNEMNMKGDFDDIETAARFVALVESSGITDMYKKAKAKVASEPDREWHYTDLGVSILTRFRKSFKVNWERVLADPIKAEMFELKLEEARARVTINASDMGLLPTRKADRPFFDEEPSDAVTVSVKKMATTGSDE